MNKQITDISNLLPGKFLRGTPLPEANFPPIANEHTRIAAMEIIAFEIQRQFVIALANSRAMIAYANENLEPGRMQIKANSFLEDTLAGAQDLCSDIEARAEMIKDARQ